MVPPPVSSVSLDGLGGPQTRFGKRTVPSRRTDSDDGLSGESWSKDSGLSSSREVRIFPVKEDGSRPVRHRRYKGLIPTGLRTQT